MGLPDASVGGAHRERGHPRCRAVASADQSLRRGKEASCRRCRCASSKKCLTRNACSAGGIRYARRPGVTVPALSGAGSFYGTQMLGSLPAHMRLAMRKWWPTQDTERRALEGELALLETASREAEEIAAIADLAVHTGCTGRGAIHGAEAATVAAATGYRTNGASVRIRASVRRPLRAEGVPNQRRRPGCGTSCGAASPSVRGRAPTCPRVRAACAARRSVAGSAPHRRTRRSSTGPG